MATREDRKKKTGYGNFLVDKQELLGKRMMIQEYEESPAKKKA